MRFVGYSLPLQNQPENDCREKGRVGINLSFHSTEPEGIAESISQCTDQTTPHDSDHLSQRGFFAVFHHDLAGKMGDTPEKEQDSQPAKQSRHRIYHLCNCGRVGCELCKQIGRQHKERRSGRMPYFQLISRRNELTTIPEAGSGFDSHQIDG